MFSQKLIVSNVILAFLNHLKCEILFIDHPWRPTYSALPFQHLWIHPWASSYPSQSYVSTLLHFSSYAQLSSILPVLPPRHLQPQLNCFYNALAFHDRFIDSLSLFVHFLKHNAIACSFFHHYFFQLFNNYLMFFTQITINITDTIFCIIYFFNCPNISFFSPCIHCYILLLTKFTLGFILYLPFNYSQFRFW